MRLVGALLFVALTGSAVLADEAKPADPKPEVTKKKVPFRVVKMLPETGQVLLYDKNKGTHVVAEVGQTLDGYAVEEIDDDAVTLTAANGTQVILTAAAPKHRVVKKAADAAPVDPYSEDGAAVAADDTAASKAATTKPDSSEAGAAPVDPYADPEPPAAPGDGGVRVATAGGAAAASPAAGSTAPAMADPASPAADPYGDPGIAAFAAAVGATPATPGVHEVSANDGKAAGTAKGKSKAGKGAKAGKAAPTSDDGAALAAAATGGEVPAPASTTTASATAAPTPAGSATVIARSELDGALGDFGKLAGSFRAAFTADGLRFDAVGDGTLLAKVGLRKGDVVTAVDGQPLRSMDDAANLYARAGSVKSTTIQVVRAAKPVTLRVAIQ